MGFEIAIKAEGASSRFLQAAACMRLPSGRRSRGRVGHRRREATIDGQISNPYGGELTYIKLGAVEKTSGEESRTGLYGDYGLYRREQHHPGEKQRGLRNRRDLL
jgi:hypothetical protein